MDRLPSWTGNNVQHRWINGHIGIRKSFVFSRPGNWRERDTYIKWRRIYMVCNVHIIYICAVLLFWDLKKSNIISCKNFHRKHLPLIPTTTYLWYIKNLTLNFWKKKKKAHYTKIRNICLQILREKCQATTWIFLVMNYF